MQQKSHHTWQDSNSACSAYKSESDYSKRRDSYSVSRYATRETATASDVAELLARFKIVWQNFNFDADERATALLQEEWYESLKDCTRVEITEAFSLCKKRFKNAPSIKDFLEAVKLARENSAPKPLPPQQLYGASAHAAHYRDLLEKYGESVAKKYEDEYVRFMVIDGEEETRAYIENCLKRIRERF